MRWPPGRVLVLGGMYQISGAFCVSYFELGVDIGRGLPAVCIWILAFSLVPASPSRAAFAAFGAAAMAPLAFVVRFGVAPRAWPGDGTEVLGFITATTAATVAVLTANVIYGLGRQVADARKLGAYILVKRLSNGGMGEIWRAEHHSLVRPAAIKLLRRELVAHLAPADLEEMNKRFQREVQATARLSSPHTVAIYDFGQTSDGSLYYVMELLAGLDAETLVTSFGPQPAERVVHVLQQAAESLAEAHFRGLVHRDVKPANLYLCAIGMELDFVKVLDFGLAFDLEHDQRLTYDGSVSGTPAYFAPESAAHSRFDARSDIYSLGCVAYWLLTGTLVFEAETSAGVIAAHIRDQPERPSKRTELPIPPELEDIVMSCLAKDPAGRPQSAQALKDMLAALPLRAWTQQRADAWWRSHLPDVVASSRAHCDAAGSTAPRRRPDPVVKERSNPSHD